MAKVDWTPEARNVGEPGIYNFEIEAADIKMGEKSGYEYISLRMRCVDDRSISIFDTLSFSPKAKGILQAKLSALGMKDVETIEPEMFPGRRIKVATKLEEDHKGDMRLIADIKAKGSKAGYFAADDFHSPTIKPTDVKQSGAFADFSDDVPFARLRGIV